jgi:outer membrane lipoprotein SlyB
MNNRAKIAICSAIVALWLVPSMAPAARAVTLASGATVNAKINQTIDSGSAYAGQKFTMSVVAPYPQNKGAFAGATLYGHVTKVVKAGQGTNAELGFAIDRMVLPNGDAGRPVLMVQSQETQHHNNTVTIALAGLAGMAVGNWIGKAVFNSNAGGAVGAIAGVLYAANSRTNVSLRQGSEVVFEAQTTVALR